MGNNGAATAEAVEEGRIISDQKAEELADTLSQVAILNRQRVGLFKDLKESPEATSLLAQIMKVADKEGNESKQGKTTGTRGHPFEMTVVKSFLTTNIHHSRSIHAKKAATVGLGLVNEASDRQKLDEVKESGGQPNFEMSEATKKLNELCNHSWQHTINPVAEDYHQIGNGYLEVVRANPKNKNSEILGLHHIKGEESFVFAEPTDDWHFEIQGEAGSNAIGSESAFTGRRFARFGDSADFIKRATDDKEGTNNANFKLDSGGTGVSEVIHFQKPTSLDKFYGFPDWLSAVPSIELVQCFLQHKYDFFLNRGVPEFLLFILGQKLGLKDWKKIETAMKANIGLGNSHKSTAINLANPDIKVQMEKLNLDAQGQDETDQKNSLALDIVSAHGVPPLLAGIQIPGKLGANNELPNSLLLFQILNIGPDQEIFENTLACTLGEPTKNGGLDVTAKDLRFRKMLDQIDLNKLSTQSRMRETVPEAQAEGRNMEDGTRR